MLRHSSDVDRQAEQLSSRHTLGEAFRAPIKEGLRLSSWMEKYQESPIPTASRVAGQVVLGRGSH